MLPATGLKDVHVAYSQWFPKLAIVNQNVSLMRSWTILL